VDEPWPLEVYGHNGKATNVTMEPGKVLMKVVLIYKFDCIYHYDLCTLSSLNDCSCDKSMSIFINLGDMVLYESHSVIHGR
jgi:hypothetical protein